MFRDAQLRSMDLFIARFLAAAHATSAISYPDFPRFILERHEFAAIRAKVYNYIAAAAVRRTYWRFFADLNVSFTLYNVPLRRVHLRFH